jgi:hypothetical protein
MIEEQAQHEVTEKPASGWIFPWRRAFRRRWSLLVAALLVLPLFALMMSLVRVRVFFTPPALNRSADLIMVPDTTSHRAWLEQVSQKTPFPAPLQDDVVQAYSDAYLLAELGDEFQPGQKLRDVWVPEVKSVFSQDACLPALPVIDSTKASTETSVGGLWQPRVRWLSALPAGMAPDEWPSFSGAPRLADGAKLMLEVDAAGRVVSCLSASKETDPSWAMVESWAKRLRFSPSKSALGWIAGEIFWEVVHD